MQRNENESFADYKTRRAAANEAVKMLNYEATHGGKIGARKQRRDAHAARRNRGIGVTRAAGTKRDK